jgi:hypothetical protein
MSFNPDQTSKRVASEASLLLRSKSSNKTAKSVAGSALAQTPYKGTLLGGGDKPTEESWHRYIDESSEQKNILKLVLVEWHDLRSGYLLASWKCHLTAARH